MQNIICVKRLKFSGSLIAVAGYCYLYAKGDIIMDEIMNAVRIICDFNHDFLLYALTGDEKHPDMELVRSSCELLATEKMYPFDVNVDDIQLMKQISEFMNSFREN